MERQQVIRYLIAGIVGLFMLAVIGFSIRGIQQIPGNQDPETLHYAWRKDRNGFPQDVWAARSEADALALKAYVEEGRKAGRFTDSPRLPDSEPLMLPANTPVRMLGKLEADTTMLVVQPLNAPPDARLYVHESHVSERPSS